MEPVHGSRTLDQFQAFKCHTPLQDMRSCLGNCVDARTEAARYAKSFYAERFVMAYDALVLVDVSTYFSRDRAFWCV